MKSFIHNSGTFIGKEGNETYFQNWTVPAPEFNLLIAHGIDNSSESYISLLDELKNKNISIYTYDHRGFGRSGGKAGHLDQFVNFVHDLDIYYELIQQFDKETPIIIYGHSLGAIIALNHMIMYPGKFNGAILSSPWFHHLKGDSQWKNKLNTVLGKYLPAKYIKTATFAQDPLLPGKSRHDANNITPITAGLYLGIQEALSFTLQNMKNINIPVLLMNSQNQQVNSDGTKLPIIPNVQDLNFLEEYIYDLNKKSQGKNGQLFKGVINWIYNILSSKINKRKIS